MCRVSDSVINDICLLYSITAGFDFIGSHFVATFAANSTSATVDIPIVADLISDEGAEYFTVQLSLQTHEIMPPLPNIYYNNTIARIGSVPQATVYILDEIILDFLDRHITVVEGANVTLTIIASRASDQNITVNVNITSTDDECKLEIDREN